MGVVPLLSRQGQSKEGWDSCLPDMAHLNRGGTLAVQTRSSYQWVGLLVDIRWMMEITNIIHENVALLCYMSVMFVCML